MKPMTDSLWQMSATKNQRLAIASKILAGFAANPVIFAANSKCGWALVNCTDEDLAGYALRLADKLIEAENITAKRKDDKP